MGVVFALAVIFIIFLSFIVLAVIFLIIGLVIRKKHPTASKIFLFLCVLNILIPASIIIYAALPQPATVETRDGTAVIKVGWMKKYDKYLKENDLLKLDDLLDKHPEMIYYYKNASDYHEGGHQFLLDYGVHNLNTEIMQIAVNHGAVFDDPLRYDHVSFDSSFEAFLLELNENIYIDGDADDKMFEVIEFMLNHGAVLQYKSGTNFKFDNFYDHMTWWVSKNGTVTDKEQQLLELIASHMENSGSD